MRDQGKLTDEELRRAVHCAIRREVGDAGLIRFLHMMHPSTGDYTYDRQFWLPEYETTEEMMEAIAREGAPDEGHKEST